MAKDLRMNIGGVYKELDKGYVNIGGVWKELDKIWTNIGGVWKEVGIELVLSYYGEFNTNDLSTRYSALASNSTHLLISGGRTGDYLWTDQVRAFNTSFVRSTPSALRFPAGSQGSGEINGYIVFAGGDYSAGTPYLDYVDYYNSSLVRNVATSLSEQRIRTRGGRTSNHLLFAGGNYLGRKATVDAYNTSLTRSTPSALGLASDERGYCSIGEYALFATGYDNNNYRTNVDAYNSSLTRTLIHLSQARDSMAGVSHGNYGLFAGGTGGDHWRIVDAFDTSLVRTTPTLLTYGGSLSGVGGNGWAVFYGGVQITPFAWQNYAQSYNPALVKAVETPLGFITSGDTVRFNNNLMFYSFTSGNFANRLRGYQLI